MGFLISLFITSGVSISDRNLKFLVNINKTVISTIFKAFTLIVIL